MTEIKRSIDLVLSLAAIVVSAPLMLAIAVSVYLIDGRPVLFRGKRVGRFGKPFFMLKFRSMVVNAEQMGSGLIPMADSRVTRLGRFLRTTKLDELPQFFNILWGDMSFVGPRPELWRYAETFTGEEREILRWRPGLTDWATLVDLDAGKLLKGAVNPDAEYELYIRPYKVTLQLDYARRATLGTDLKILSYTAKKLVFRGWVPSELRCHRQSLDCAMTRRAEEAVGQEVT